MSTTIAPVVAKLEADTTSFEAGFARAGDATEALEQTVRDTEDAVRALGEHGGESLGKVAEHASFLGEALEGAGEALGDMAKQFAIASLAAAGIEKIAEGIKEFAAESLKAGADAQSLDVQFHSLFGAGAEEASEWAEKTGGALGRSRDDMIKAANAAKIMLDGMGLASEESTKMSESFADLAAKMSIAQNVPLPEAIQALSAGLHGAGRGLYEYGIALNSATQNQESMRLGLGDTYAKLTVAQQAQVNFSIIMQQQSEVTARAAAATGTYNNQMASLKSNAEELQAHLASGVNPELANLVHVTNEAVTAFDKLNSQSAGWATTVLGGPMALLNRMSSEIAEKIEKLAGITPASEINLGADPEAGAKALAAANDRVHREVQQRMAEAAQAEADRQAQAEKDQEELQAQWEAYQKIKEAAEQHAHQLVAQLIQQEQAEQYAADAAHIAAAQKAADLHMKDVEDAAATQRGADQQAIRVAQDAIAAAKQHLADVGGGSLADVMAAQASVQKAFGLAQSAAATAISDVQQQIDANNNAIMALSAVHGSETEIEKFRRANIELEKQLTGDQHELEAIKRANIELARHELEAYQAGQGLGSAGAKLAGSTQFGRMAGDVAAASAGGPVAMGAAAGVDLLQASAGGKAAIAAADKIFQELADTVGKIIEPLVPVIESVGQALQPLLESVGKVLGDMGKALAPVLQAVVGPLLELAKPLGDLIDSVEPLIGPIMQITAIIAEVADLFDPFTLAMKALGPAIEEVAKAINWVIDGIKGVWNGIVDAVASVLDALAHALPSSAGDAMRALYYQVEGMKIGTDAFGKTLEDGKAALEQLNHGYATLTQTQLAAIQAYIAEQQQQEAVLRSLGGAGVGAADALQQQIQAEQQQLGSTTVLTQAQIAAAQAAQQFANAAASAYQQEQDYAAKAKADFAAYQYFSGKGDKKSADAAFSNYQQDLKSEQQANYTYAIDAVKQREASAGGDANAVDPLSRSGQTFGQELAALLKQQAEFDALNTSATAANTKATQENTSALIANAVSGFNAGAYESSAASSGGSSGSGGSRGHGRSRGVGDGDGGGSTKTTNITVHVYGANGKEVVEQLKKENFYQTGNFIEHGSGGDSA